jgi:phosphomannomutase/phosphoglucomutase
MGLCLWRGDFGPARQERPVVAMANDGRPGSAELVAACDEGLRRGGCHVVEIGPAGAACLRFAVDHLGTDAALLVLGPGGREEPAALHVWTPGDRPLEHLGREAIAQCYFHGVDRPDRRGGGSRRFDATGAYLDQFRPAYHALRPLRIAWDGRCRPARRCFNQLLAGVACRVIEMPLRDPTTAADNLTAVEAHLGVIVDRLGQTLGLLDERGRPVELPRLQPVLEDASIDEAERDAIRLLTALLPALSRDDRPLSLVLDRAAARA